MNNDLSLSKHLLRKDKRISPVFLRLTLGVTTPCLACEEIPLRIAGILVIVVSDYNILLIALPPVHPAMQHMPPPHLLILRQPLRLLNQMLNLYTSLVINHIIIRTSSSALGFARFWQVVPYSCQIPHSL